MLYLHIVQAIKASKVWHGASQLIVGQVPENILPLVSL